MLCMQCRNRDSSMVVLDIWAMLLHLVTSKHCVCWSLQTAAKNYHVLHGNGIRIYITHCTDAAQTTITGSLLAKFCLSIVFIGVRTSFTERGPGPLSTLQFTGITTFSQAELQLSRDLLQIFIRSIKLHSLMAMENNSVTLWSCTFTFGCEQEKHSFVPEPLCH